MKKIVIVGIVYLSIFVIKNGYAQSAMRIKEFNLENGLAIKGYDPVAYFLQKKAVKGSAQFSTTVDGVVYHFSSVANKEVFINAYKKYEPQFGGWCAYAMGATNDKVDVDPETFKIANGKLYLFYHSWVNNTLVKWNKDEVNIKSKAEKNWHAIFQY
jgi:YHS domain-containing protein